MKLDDVAIERYGYIRHISTMIGRVHMIKSQMHECVTLELYLCLSSGKVVYAKGYTRRPHTVIQTNEMERVFYIYEDVLNTKLLEPEKLRQNNQNKEAIISFRLIGIKSDMLIYEFSSFTFKWQSDYYCWTIVYREFNPLFK